MDALVASPVLFDQSANLMSQLFMPLNEQCLARSVKPEYRPSPITYVQLKRPPSKLTKKPKIEKIEEEEKEVKEIAAEQPQQPITSAPDVDQSGSSDEPLDIEKVAVIGCGMMGTGIAHVGDFLLRIYEQNILVREIVSRDI